MMDFKEEAFPEPTELIMEEMRVIAGLGLDEEKYLKKATEIHKRILKRVFHYDVPKKFKLGFEYNDALQTKVLVPANDETAKFLSLLMLCEDVERKKIYGRYIYIDKNKRRFNIPFFKKGGERGT